MLQIVSGFTILLMLISCYIIYKQHSVNIQLAKLKEEQNSLNQNLDTEKNKIPTEQEIGNLKKELMNLQDLSITREKMYTTLSQIQNKIQPGFSGYLSALATYVIDDIWFTKLEFSDGGNVILLEGKTIAAKNLPKLLYNLGKDPMFSGKKFDSVHIYSKEEDKGILYFNVKTNL